jgi:DNA-binding NtrC family response regulator
LNRILLVDDDRIVRLALRENLRDFGFEAVEASSGKEAIKLLQKVSPHLVLTDLKMPDMDGVETMQELRKIAPDIPVVIMTAHGDIPTAVEAIQHGAYDFIAKPVDYDRLVVILKRAVEKSKLNEKITQLSGEVKSSLKYLIGSGEAIKKVIHQIQQVSQSDFSLILQGETGTGKSFISRAIHNLSNRVKGPFVTVDIGTLPETLVESELFGHEKGAFTGAEKKKKGYFEIADGGTLLIDELQNLTPYVQGKLLMAVEEKKIYPVGSTHPVKTDVRIIGATNKDIQKLVREEKSFREDLFYRLGEFMIFLPSLRERTEDIPFLSEKFFREVSDDMNKQINSISAEAMSMLKDHPWPGNIRELKNVIRRAVLYADDEVIRPEHIEFLNSHESPVQKSENTPSQSEFSGISLKEAEKIAIEQALKVTEGNKTKAAAILQIDYTTLLRKIKQYCI